MKNCISCPLASHVAVAAAVGRGGIRVVVAVAAAMTCLRMCLQGEVEPGARAWR